MDINELIQKRDAARQTKDFVLADELRRQAESAGYRLVDTNNGATFNRVFEWVYPKWDKCEMFKSFEDEQGQRWGYCTRPESMQWHEEMNANNL